MNTNLTIRVEEPRDFRTVENLTREAFWNVYHPGCTEHYVLRCFRSNPDFIPELSLVMEKDGQIIGHVMFSKAELNIEADGKPTGEKLSIATFGPMEGNINFYRHAGFDLASKLHIHYHCEPKDSEVPYFLAQELIPGYLNGIEATYTPPKGYFVAEENPEAFAKYEAEFPYKEKLVLPGQLG